MTPTRRAALVPIVPGVYGDAHGLHLDIPQILLARQIDDTPANRRRWSLRAFWYLRDEHVSGLIVAHLGGLTRH